MLNKNILLITLVVFIAKTSVWGKLYPRVVADRDRITKSDWEQLAGTGKISRPQGGVILRTNNGQPVILFTDYSANKVGMVKYIETTGSDADSIFLKDYGSCGTGSNQFCSPQGFKILNANNVFIADVANNRISRGQFYMNDFYISSSSPVGGGAIMNEPMDVEPYNEGGIIKIYVADTKNNRILKLSSTGSIEQSYGVFGDGVAQFKKPRAIAKHGSYIYIADTYNDRIVTLYEESDGTFTWHNTFSAPEGLALFVSVDCDLAGNVFFVDQAHCKIYKFTEGLGEMLWVQGTRGIYTGQFQDPMCININEGTDDALVVEAWTDYTGLRLLRNRIDILTAQSSKTIFEPAKENLALTYKIDDAAKMLIRVMTETNDTLKRTLVNNFTFPAGTSSITWDGKDSLGRLILPGKYKIEIQATDGYGNKAVKYVNFTVKGTRCPQNLNLQGIWNKEGSPYVILGTQTDYTVGPALYIEPGTEIMFWPHGTSAYSFSISDTIKALGTQEEKITFTSYRKPEERVPGDWYYIGFAGRCSTSILKNCIVEYGGAGTETSQYRCNIFYNAATSSAKIEDCIIRTSTHYGIYASTTGDGSIVNCLFENNAYYPLCSNPNGIGRISGNRFINNGIQGIQVAGGTISRNATWENQGVPYYAYWGFNIFPNTPTGYCSLTVAAGCSLLMGPYSNDLISIGVDANRKGCLITQGTQLSPVVITSSVPDSGWRGIWINNGGSANLQYTNIQGTKLISQASYALYCYNAPGDTVLAQHCSFEDGDSIGINLPGNYGPVILDNCRIAGNRCIGLYSDRTYRNLRISETIFENNGTYPLVLPPKQIDGLLSATFVNNGNNVIRVKYGSIDSSVIWRNFNVPYYLEKSCQIGVRSPWAASVCTLTIAPRCTVLMDSNSYFQIGYSLQNYYHGVLLADGEGGEIVFNSIDSTNKNGLLFEAQSGGYLNKCTFRGGGGLSTIARSVIRSNTNQFVMRQCHITGSDSIGLYLGASPLQVKYSEFAFNPIGIYSTGNNPRVVDSCNIWNNKHYGAYCTGSGILKVENCWWGNPTGPYDPSPDTLTGGWYNPDGLGDKVSDSVDYTPWLAAPLLLQINSSSKYATAYNNGKRLLYDKNNQLHLAYSSNDSIIYQRSLNDGCSWLAPVAFSSGGSSPVAVVGMNATDTTIAWTTELPSSGWALKTADKKGTVWDTLKTIVEIPGYWDQLHLVSPPSMAVNSAGTHLVMENIDSYYNAGVSYIWYWRLLYGFRPVGSDIFTWLTLDSTSGTGGQIEDPTSPTICIDLKGGIHIAWDYEGEIYWRMLDPYTNTWKTKQNLSYSPDVNSDEPSLSVYGDVHLVWEEGNDIYHMAGNWGLPRAVKSKVILKSFVWWLNENISNNPETPSTDPVYDGNYASWCETLNNGDTEIYLSKYVDFSWQPYENYSNSPSLFSCYPQIAYRQSTESNNVATAWAEGRDPLYTIIFRDTTGPFTPQLSADLGGSVPSIYTVERDSYFIYTSKAKTTGDITVDYDTTALVYYIPTLDKDQKQTIKVNLYQEYSDKANYLYKISVNDIPLGAVQVPSGEKVCFEKELPKVISDSGEGYLRIENIKGGLVTCDWWELYSYSKENGNGRGHGGTQFEEITDIAPNFINKLYQNAPNPFNAKTVFRYQLKTRGQASLKIYNALGQLVKTLVNETKPAGVHQVEWDGRDGCGLKVSSGVYIYRLQTGAFMETKKMVVIK